MIPLDSMSIQTYTGTMSSDDKPIVWLHGEVKTPPLSQQGRVQAGFLLRRLQRGERLPMPHSRPMPSLGRRCHELRVADESGTWRIIYRVDDDAIVILDVFQKKSSKTPKRVIEVCRRRLREYDSE
jgi:phage-related protein